MALFVQKDPGAMLQRRQIVARFLIGGGLALSICLLWWSLGVRLSEVETIRAERRERLALEAEVSGAIPERLANAQDRFHALQEKAAALAFADEAAIQEWLRRFETHFDAYEIEPVLKPKASEASPESASDSSGEKREQLSVSLKIDASRKHSRPYIAYSDLIAIMKTLTSRQERIDLHHIETVANESGIQHATFGLYVWKGEKL